MCRFKQSGHLPPHKTDREAVRSGEVSPDVHIAVGFGASISHVEPRVYERHRGSTQIIPEIAQEDSQGFILSPWLQLLTRSMCVGTIR